MNYNIYDFLQLCGGIILAVGYVPQLIQIIKTQSVEDLNLKTFLSILVGVSMMQIYAINLVHNGTGIAFLITNSISLFMAGLMVLLIMIYRIKEMTQKE